MFKTVEMSQWSLDVMLFQCEKYHLIFFSSLMLTCLIETLSIRYRYTSVCVNIWGSKLLVVFNFNDLVSSVRRRCYNSVGNRFICSVYIKRRR